MNAAMPPAFWALATACSATVVLWDRMPLAIKLCVSGMTTLKVGCRPQSSIKVTSS